MQKKGSKKIINKEKIDSKKNSDNSEYLKPVIKIENIVVSASLHAVIDLYELSKNVKAVTYEPEQFPGAIFKVSEPKAVIILFKNGKMICTGANNEPNIRKVLEYAAGIISKYVLEVLPAEKKTAEKKK